MKNNNDIGIKINGCSWVNASGTAVGTVPLRRDVRVHDPDITHPRADGIHLLPKTSLF